MLKSVLVALCSLLLSASTTVGAAAPPADVKPSGRRVKVLFLGDDGPHKPLDRARQVHSSMARRGVDLVYTDRISDLNERTLAPYDAVLLYADYARIAPEQEQALLAFVAGGKGFVPIHAGSGCFPDSAAVTALIGGRIKSNGTGTFEETLVDTGHPVTKGLKPIKSMDEAATHDAHNEKDRTVLAVRAAGDAKEPLTWVRTHEKGRVFYTAWGHDGRTWGNEDFQNLLERGIRWAAGDWALAPRPTESSFTYVPANVPNYPPSRQWGTLGEPIKTMQEPVSPAESMRHLILPPGFKAELFASEPQIKKPICMAWDERGRLWVAETMDYPNEMQPEGKGRDQITICEDTDGDGTADKFTVFADKLSIPTAICFANGGVIVMQAPHTLFFKDTDGDGKADERKVLHTGWGTRDTHAGPSNLRYGFDNWLYGAIGYSGFRGTVGGQQVSFGQGLFRMKPDGSKLEFLGSSNNNTWGIGLTEDGSIVASTANGNPSFSCPIPNRYYETVGGLKPRRLGPIADSPRYFPANSARVRVVDNHDRYTAGAGHALYTARSFPKEYWNRIAFVAEPTGHLVGKFVINKTGSDFTARNDFSFLMSDDEWTAPIMAEVGPDGALWVIDWYNFIVQHNPIPRGFVGGRGGAYETPLRDKRHGRVYRMTSDGGAPSKTFKLSNDDPATLLAALKSDNMLWRLHAQRLLVERNNKDVAPQLVEIATGGAADEIGLNAPAIHAIWTLVGLDAADDATIQKALGSGTAGVRKAAIEAAPRAASSVSGAIKLLGDADLQVRKVALLALSEMPPSDAAGAAVLAVLEKRENAEDKWIVDAATIAAARHDAGFLQSVFATYAPQDGQRASAGIPAVVKQVAAAVTTHYAQRGPTESVVGTLARLEKADPQLATAVVAALADGWPAAKKPELSAGDVATLRRVAAALPKEAKDRVIALGGRWGRSDIFAADLGEVVKELRATLAGGKAEATARIDAAKRLVEVEDSQESVKLILSQVAPTAAPELQTGLLDALSASKDAKTGEAVVSGWGTYSPTAQRGAIAVVLRKPAWTEALLAAVEAGKVNPKDLRSEHWQILTGSKEQAIAARARKLEKSSGGTPNPDKAKLIEALIPQVEKGGDAARGKLVYAKNCAVCHAIGSEGGKVGPDLTGIGARAKSDLVIEILDPNRSVEGTYRQWTVETEDQILYGRMLAESRTTIEIIDAAGKVHAIDRKNVQGLAASERSVMPEGFEQSIPAADLSDLLEYLSTSKEKH
jgi:hypothetical protein